MPELVITTIQCHTTEDNNANDELYVLLDGARVFGPQEIANNQSIQPNIRKYFDGSVNVQLWDEDSLDPDDKLGEFDVLAAERGQGDRRRDLHAGGASYTVHYRVE